MSANLEIEDFSLVAREPVHLKAPYPVTELFCIASTKTSISLQWKASRSADVTYEVYNGAALLGTTSQTNFVADSLTVNTTYTFSVKCRDTDGYESEGNTIIANTLNIYAYATVKTPAVTKIEFPMISFHYIEAVVSVVPYKNTWNQFFLEAPEQSCGVKWEYDGRRISPSPSGVTSKFGEMYVNDVEVPWTTYDTIPENTKVTLGFAIKEGNMASSTVFLGNGTHITPANLYEVRFYEINGFMEKTLTARYQFTEHSLTSSIPDGLGKHADATIANGNYVIGV